MRLLVFIIVSLFTLAYSKECHKDWVKYEEHCYNKLPSAEIEYYMAQELCEDVDANVLTIDTRRELDFASRYLVHQGNNVWIDANNSKYQKWVNDTVRKDVKEVKANDCAVVVHIRRHESSYMKERCDNRNEVVCKKDPEYNE